MLSDISRSSQREASFPKQSVSFRSYFYTEKAAELSNSLDFVLLVKILPVISIACTEWVAVHKGLGDPLDLVEQDQASSGICVGNSK